MSYPSSDAIGDYFQDHKFELLCEFLEDERHWKDFESWLWDDTQNEIREALFEHFLSQYKSKEYLDFEGWAYDRSQDKLIGG